ncbi:uncharacterized protein [Amphiura filiformis]|uniref:uncharacterized protein isoform X1 n=1 Tax=Amphiura filiformis TaxID=82378 RepID=UPI003B215414
MRFIQNHELREWVKESLRRAIFQKAHALAMQTGCEILIKLQDDSDATASHQYYGTKVLRQAYHNNRLRMHPEDKLVSGETGMPVISQSTCMQIGTDDSMGNNGLEGLMIGDHGMIQAEFQEQYLANGETMTEPATQLREINTFADKSHDHIASTTSGSVPEVRIKVEKLENSEEATLSCGTSHDDTSESLSESSFPRSTVSINPKPYQCAVCHKAFRSIQVLQKHTQTFHVRPHHSMGALRNRGKGGHILNRLPPHERYHDVTIPPGLPPDLKGFYCIICNQDFPNPSALQDHMTVSHMDTSNDDNSSDAPHQNLTSSKSAANEKSTAGPNVPKQALFIAPPDPGSSTQLSIATSSSVPIFMTLPSSSSPPAAVSPGVPFCQSSPTGPIFSHPGLPVGFSRASTSSGRKTGSKKHRFRNKISLQSAMTAILLTAGPIVTHRAVSSYGPGYIRSAGFYIAKDQFMHAAEKLELAQFGTLMKFTSAAFIKQHPDEIQGDIEVENLILCRKEVYRTKFNKPVARCITKNSTLMRQLYSTGVITEEVMVHDGTVNMT